MDPDFRILRADEVLNTMVIEHIHGAPPRASAGLRICSKRLKHPLASSNLWFFIRATPTEEFGVYDVAVRPASYEELPMAERLDQDVLRQLDAIASMTHHW